MSVFIEVLYKLIKILSIIILIGIVVGILGFGYIAYSS